MPHSCQRAHCLTHHHACLSTRFTLAFADAAPAGSNAHSRASPRTASPVTVPASLRASPWHSPTPRRLARTQTPAPACALPHPSPCLPLYAFHPGIRRRRAGWLERRLPRQPAHCFARHHACLSTRFTLAFADAAPAGSQAHSRANPRTASPVTMPAAPRASARHRPPRRAGPLEAALPPACALPHPSPCPSHHALHPSTGDAATPAASEADSRVSEHGYARHSANSAIRFSEASAVTPPAASNAHRLARQISSPTERISSSALLLRTTPGRMA
jgi:hypothetical protein